MAVPHPESMGTAHTHVTCPDCLTDLDGGNVNRRCTTCTALYASFTRLREHIYASGSTGDLAELSRASGVDPSTISRMIRIGYLKVATRDDAGRRVPCGCDVCGRPSDGTALCATCRERFMTSWERAQEARAARVDHEPLEIPAELAAAADGYAPLDEDFAALLAEESHGTSDAAPRGNGMYSLQRG